MSEPHKMGYSIAWHPHGAIKRFLGATSFQELLASERDVAGHPNFSSLRYVISDHLQAQRIQMSDEQRSELMALRVGGYFTNPRIKFAFVTQDLSLQSAIARNIANGWVLHPMRVFESIHAATEWACQ